MKIWDMPFLGTDVYHVVHWLLIYSILGWVVESIYMSFCNKKLINRGFIHGPMCPIYGVGALTVYFVLRPLEGNWLALYFGGTFLATSLEYVTAIIMQKIFGCIWWDYNDKFCNYKGVICLESTLAWGLYAVIIITFLFDKVIGFVDRYPRIWGLKTIALVFAMAIIDFGYHFAMSVKIDEETREDFIEKKDEIVDFCHRLIGR